MHGDNSDDDSPAQTQTRSSQRKNDQYLCPSNRSIPELLANPQTPSSVIDAATARIELTSRGMLIPASGASIETLIESLLEFTLQAPKLTRLHTDVIRAIAIMLDQVDYTQKAQHIAKETTTQLSGLFNRMEKLIDRQEAAASLINPTSGNMVNPQDPSVADQVAAVIAPQMEKVIIITKTLTDTLGQAEEIQHSLIREREEKEQNLKTSAERIEEAADAFYQSAKDCQNAMKLLTPSIDSAQNKINSLTTQLQSQPEACPPTDNRPPHVSDAVRSFTPGPADQVLARAAIKACQILIDLTPEEENLLKTDSLASIRWIKPPERRPPGQLTAFAMLQVSDAATANQLLKDGLYINREKLQVRKDQREPI
ncbi:hypothetical protein DFH29DRAFT_1001519 [Suillus ampliporus]|nr:hypothetical protein DFH29DRAFT_1001519 [Suillus ampliporus]